MPCRESIVSEETYDYVTDFPIAETPEPDSILCTERVDDRFEVIYVDNAKLPSLESGFYEYQGIPKLYGLMQIEGDNPILSPGNPQPFDPAPLIASGIVQAQGPPLNLTGFGTVICFIDTGIDYANPLFRDELGNTRIEAIWDQTDQSGKRPDGFQYGTEYTKDQINLALRSSNPLEVVPSRDEIGHGTALASVAAGNIAGLARMGFASQEAVGGAETMPGQDGPSTMEGQYGSSTMPGQDGPSTLSRQDGLATLSGQTPLGQLNSQVRDIPLGFRGAAPEAEIVVVKLKTAKEYLKRYYLVPDQAVAYQENDIMLAVKYCDQYARLFQRPIVICIGIGTSMGDHNGTSPLSAYLNSIAVKRNRVVVACGGNEGNASGHYRGNLLPSTGAGGLGTGALQTVSKSVEIRVAEGNQGFFMELWGKRTNVINVGLRSPGGETIPPIPLGLQQSITFGFVYERTEVTIYSSLVEAASGDELILFRIVEPTPGIWTIRVIGQADLSGGTFDIWLPIRQFQSSPVYFLSPDPDVTLTEPAMATQAISVSAYQAANASFYIDSGRGFTRANEPRPDLAAPGVDVSTVYGKQSGTGFAAALTAGAVAQLLQWAVVEKNNIFADSRVIKGYLIRGAKREDGIYYPNEEWGYGRLNLEGVFNALIGG